MVPTPRITAALLATAALLLACAACSSGSPAAGDAGKPAAAAQGGSADKRDTAACKALADSGFMPKIRTAAVDGAVAPEDAGAEIALLKKLVDESDGAGKTPDLVSQLTADRYVPTNMRAVQLGLEAGSGVGDPLKKLDDTCKAAGVTLP